MTLMLWSSRTKERRATILAGLILLQTVSALFFMGDVVADLRGGTPFDNPHVLIESVAAVALIAGVIFMMIELRSLLSRMSDMQSGLDIARGHLGEVIGDFFHAWKLTAAERDVAIMILKGLDNDTIASMRNTAPGTVRAQATGIYAKSGTTGRAQFISLFMEELMSGELDPDAQPAPKAEAREARPLPDSARAG